MSKVLSPFRIEALVAPGDNGQIILDLIGEDSREIIHQVFKTQRGWIAPTIDFKISAVAELARLVLKTQDAYNRLISLTSIDLLLLSFGDAEIKSNLSELAPYDIWSPQPNESISGGSVPVKGLARLVNESPLIFELIDEQGTVIAQEKLDVPKPDEENGHTHTPFEINIPYSITQTTKVRLTIRQESTGRLPGTVELKSLLITLEP